MPLTEVKRYIPAIILPAPLTNLWLLSCAVLHVELAVKQAYPFFSPYFKTGTSHEIRGAKEQDEKFHIWENPAFKREKYNSHVMCFWVVFFTSAWRTAMTTKGIKTAN